MKNDDFMKRLKAMAEIAAKISKEQEAQKDREAAEAEDDDMDLAADMLMEASDLLDEAGDLLYQAAAILRGEDIEADCYFPYCVMEVSCDDEL